ncbi:MULTISPECIES: ribosomal protein S18-alanine N-acetyltransferase [Microbulbifer]|uniref:Ribosomal protein S18-alanine N-acetyltransferase n=1 Tax=Microbulbifer celer TaxID=435905 RepID=A0ABW3U5E9_9GAMM|nr:MULTISPECIES: ribosomal protein S18-alanine N-acetyltransferase [Microbulbifer]UFN56210.1 ribosomal protein S18-alanine N-acetyltransferase [Microbulbifer celer]
MTDLKIPPAGLVFVRACANDSDALAALAEQTQIHPWSADQYRQSLASGHLGWLLRTKPQREPAGTQPGDIVACCVTSQLFDEVEVLDVAVSNHWRRQGLAEYLLQRVFTELADDIHRVLLEVRVSNRAARNLYRKLGFMEEGRRKNYYPNPDGSREDALIMSLLR